MPLWVRKTAPFLPIVYTALTKKLQSLCASASRQVDSFAQYVPNLARDPAHPREPLPEEAMNTLFQAEESSFRTAKRIAVVVAGMGLLGLALWVGVVMAWHVASGR